MIGNNEKKNFFLKEAIKQDQELCWKKQARVESHARVLCGRQDHVIQRNALPFNGQ